MNSLYVSRFLSVLSGIPLLGFPSSLIITMSSGNPFLNHHSSRTCGSGSGYRPNLMLS